MNDDNPWAAIDATVAALPHKTMAAILEAVCSLGVVDARFIAAVRVRYQAVARLAEAS